MLKDEIDIFISKVAAAVPLPGGGSVAALAGALAAALGEMMAGLTEKREKFSSVQSRVENIHIQLVGFRNGLLDLVHEDAAAYQALLDSIRLPRKTEEQSRIRTAAVEAGIREATKTPLRTARISYEVLECLKILADIGNPSAKSDVAVGAQLAYASLKGAQYNILTNIRMLKDASFAESCSNEISDLLHRGRQTLSYIDSLIISG